MRHKQFTNINSTNNITFISSVEIDKILSILPVGYRSEFIRESIIIYSIRLGYKIDSKELSYFLKNQFHLEYIFKKGIKA